MTKTIKRDRLADYQNSRAYKRILETHSLDEYGIWQVFGEDSNCDMGGSHYMPELGTYEGKLADVLAVELPNFWQWGSGGDLRKSKVIKPIKVDAATNAKRDAIKQRMMSHINTGKIITTSTRGPSSVKNCINYEIREIKNAKI